MARSLTDWQTWTLYLFAAAVLSPGSCSAATLQFLSVNGAVAGGVYVAPYTVSLDGTLADVMCLDADRHVNFNDVWNVNVNQIGDSGLDFALSPDAELKYKAAAVLWTWLQDGTIGKAEGSFAVWNMFHPEFSSAPGGAGAALSQTQALEFVQTHSDLDYSTVQFLTPVNHGPFDDQFQEFITGRVSDVPEPGPFVTAGGGLLLLVGVKYWRKQRNTAKAECQSAAS